MVKVSMCVSITLTMLLKMVYLIVSLTNYAFENRLIIVMLFGIGYWIVSWIRYFKRFSLCYFVWQSFSKNILLYTQ